jgi:hypothetical protein
MKGFLNHDHCKRGALCRGARRRGDGGMEGERWERWYVCVIARAKREGNLLGGTAGL